MVDRPRPDRRTRFPRPPLELIRDEMWSLSGNRHFTWFCADALLVDEFEPIDNTVPALALATHYPYRYQSATDAHFDPEGRIEASFSTLDVGNPPLWRCDITRLQPIPWEFAIGGAYDDELLTELRSAELLLLIDRRFFETWTRDHIIHVIPNDREMWRALNSESGHRGGSR